MNWSVVVNVPVPWQSDAAGRPFNPPKVAYLTPDDAESVVDVVDYYYNNAGTPMVDAWTTAGRWVSLPQAFVEVGY